MGFYLELAPHRERNKEFIEVAPPVTYWVLYAIGIFAIACMLAAAHQVLGGLLSEGTVLDWLILAILGFVFVLFAAVGFKMAALRRFIRVQSAQLQIGYFCFGYPVILRQIGRGQVKEVILLNQKPAANMAPRFHDDPQYFVRGHWRVLVYPNQQRPILIDKHVEKEALESIYHWVHTWWKDATG